METREAVPDHMAAGGDTPQPAQPDGSLNTWMFTDLYLYKKSELIKLQRSYLS